jgi:hypothetical protein
LQEGDTVTIASKHRYSLAVGSGLAYGLGLRLLFHWPHLWGAQIDPSRSILYPTDLWVMTFGFLVVAPFTIGWICTAGSRADERSHWAAWIFAPWLAILLSFVILFLAAIEGAICIIMATPIALAIGSLGGIAGGLAARSRILSSRSTTLCLAVLPLLLPGFEMQRTAPLDTRTVSTSIRIHAPAAVVWNNVKTVPRIDHSEIQPTWTHAIGFPLPVEATLDHDGVGGVRHATFEGGLLFVETIDEWEPGQRIGFTIAADTAHIPPTTLDEHVTIGGRFFDVLDGEYRLEPLANGDILLHLRSRQRLNTDFNAYAALWTDAVMRNLQQSILEVVKHRCEAEARE